MYPDQHNDAEESRHDHDDQTYVPYDGFVNVNDIVNKRRQLRNADFNVNHETWDADFNIQSDQDSNNSPK